VNVDSLFKVSGEEVGQLVILQRPDRDCDQLFKLRSIASSTFYIRPVAATQPVTTGLFKDWLVTSLNRFISSCDQFYIHTSKMIHCK